MRNNNTNNHNFSLASVGIATLEGNRVGMINVPMSLDLSGVVPENIKTMGGYSDFPVAARAGRRTGEAKLVVNECPAWLQRIANGGQYAELAASPDSATVGTPQVVSGSEAGLASIDSNIQASTTAASGIYYFTADSDNNLEINAHTNRGNFRHTILAADFSKDTQLAGLGVSISGVTAFTSEGEVSVEILPAFSKGDRTQYSSQSTHSEFKLRAWTVSGRGETDSLNEIRLNRIMFLGMTTKYEDNVSNAGAEITIQMLEPTNGEVVWEEIKVS